MAKRDTVFGTDSHGNNTLSDAVTRQIIYQWPAPTEEEIRRGKKILKDTFSPRASSIFTKVGS